VFLVRYFQRQEGFLVGMFLSAIDEIGDTKSCEKKHQKDPKKLNCFSHCVLPFSVDWLDK